MKKTNPLAVIALCGTIAVVIAFVVYLAAGTKPAEEFSPERYVLIQEYLEDEDGITSGRVCLYDIVSEEIVKVDEGEIDEEKFCGYDILTEDYERISSGKITPEEKKALKGLVEEDLSEE